MEALKVICFILASCILMSIVAVRAEKYILGGGKSRAGRLAIGMLILAGFIYFAPTIADSLSKIYF